jgi:hypothetical protein
MPPSSKTKNKRVAETSAPEASKNQLKKLCPSTSKKAGPILDVASELPKANSFIDPHLAELFHEVEVPAIFNTANDEDEQGFRTATIVFWRAYFVYQRGQTPEGRQELLTMVKKNIHDGPQFPLTKYETYMSDTWEKEYEKLMKKVVDNSKVMCKHGWKVKRGLHSRRILLRLGIPFNENLSDSPRRSKIKMKELQPSEITTVERNRTASIKKQKSEPALGIEWGGRQIFDIFDFLTEIAETEVQDVGDGSGDITWFDPDPGNKWYNRFSHIATTVLLQLLHIEHGFADVKGKKPMKSKQVTRNVLMRLPTVWTEEERFPISGGSLHEWTVCFQNNAIIEEPEPSLHGTDHRKIINDEPADVGTLALQEHQSQGEGITQQLFDQVSEVSQNAALVESIDSFPIHDLTNILAFHPPKLHLTEYERAFVNSNVYGQALLVIERLDAELSRLDLLMHAIEVERDFIRVEHEKIKNKERQFEHWLQRMESYKKEREEWVAKDSAHRQMVANNPQYRMYNSISKPAFQQSMESQRFTDHGLDWKEFAKELSTRSTTR